MVTELEAAERLLIRLAQEQRFMENINRLQKKQELSNKSSILDRRPFLDIYGLLQVEGRLRNANLEYSSKYPLILHRKAHLFKLLARHLHETAQHTGPTTLLGLLSLTHYVIGGR